MVRPIGLVLLAALAATADTAVLRNGARIQIERHEVRGDHVHLVTQDGGWIRLPASSVARFESEDEPLAPPAKPVGAAAPTTRAVVIESALPRIAAEEGMPLALVRAVAIAESGLRQDAVSPKGAIGVMQLMPSTAGEVGVDPHLPEENVRGGIRYLKQMLGRYDGDEGQIVKALAAYNAGPGSVDRYGGTPPYPETEGYVAKVIRLFLEGSQESD